MGPERRRALEGTAVGRLEPYLERDVEEESTPHEVDGAGRGRAIATHPPELGEGVVADWVRGLSEEVGGYEAVPRERVRRRSAQGLVDPCCEIGRSVEDAAERRTQ